MGILEVHDGRNRVERVKLTRENPVLFGTNPMCDIVLAGPGIAPFHGRIRWADRRFKVDAGAEVAALEINGKPLRSSTLYQGDEIAVGDCRIFVISVEDPAGAGSPNASPPADDRTRILDTPAAIAAAAAANPRPAAAAANPRPAASPPKSKPSRAAAPPPPVVRDDAGGLEFNIDDDDLGEAEEPPKPARRGDHKPGELLRRGKNRRREEAPEPLLFAPSSSTGNAPPSAWDKLKARLPRSKAPPGQEKLLSSPLVLGLGGALVLMLVLSVSLYRIISKNNADKGYNRAVESLNDGDYPNAMLRFDEFLGGYPRDIRVNKAKVLRAMANVRQFTGSAGASWTNALNASTEMVDQVGSLKEFEDVANELGEQLIKVVENQADRAKLAADPKPLEEVDAAIALHAKVLGESAAKLFEKSKGPSKIVDARAAILKNTTRSASLANMDKSLADKKPSAVYDERDKLVRGYPDQANDRDLIARLTKANDLIRADAVADQTHRAGQTTPRSDPLGPPLSFVLRSNPGVKASGGPLVFALSDGFGFGIDGATGTPVWMIPLGLASPFTPLAIVGGDPSALAFDARHDELIKIDAKSGKLIWRQEIGERITDPPLIVGTQIYQATPSGKLLVIDLRSGNVVESLKVGRPLARAPVIDESGEHLYILGDEDCLFILNRNPLACVGVEYLGHDAGTIACPPARVGRFVVVSENLGMNDGRWRVLLLDEKGLNPKVVQTIPIAGWTWSSPRDVGSILWSVSDRNEVSAFTIGLYDSPDPLKLLARLNPDNDPSGPAYAFAKSDRELWVGSGRTSRLNLVPETAKLEPAWSIGNLGPAVAPIQEAGKLVVFAHQAIKSPGLSLRGVDPNNAQVVWHTILGAPFPVGLEPSADGSGLRTLGPTGEPIAIPATLAKAGGFVEGAIPPPGGFSLPPSGDLWLPIDGPTVVVPGRKSDRFLVKAVDGFKPVSLPSPLRTDPILWGKDAFLPCDDGRAYLINPHTGEPVADPFVPPFDRAHPCLWRVPAKLDDDALALADEEGNLRRVIRAGQPRPHLEITADVKLATPLAAELASTGGSIIVLTTDGEVRAFAARDLGPVGKWKLEAPHAAGPIAAGGHAFVADSAGNVLAFGHDGKLLWKVKLGDVMAPGAPAVKDGVVWFLTRSGGLEGRSLADGSAKGKVALGVLPTGGVIDVGTDRYVPSGRGTIRALRSDLAATAGPEKAADGAKP